MMRSRSATILFIAFASGLAALLYQMVWMRWFQILFGSSAYAASATLCAYFAGLAIGAEVFGRQSMKLKRPLLAYAGLEAAAAVVALGVPLVFDVYDAIYPVLYERLESAPLVFVSVKLVLAVLAMLPASMLLGGIFPLLASAAVSDVSALGKSGARLYAINTVGAALGSALGALWLPDWIGVQATYALAISVSLAAAFIAVVLQRIERGGAIHETEEDQSTHDPAPFVVPRAGLRAVAFASGFGTLALEVLLIHAIAQRLEFSVYSFGAVMVVVLLCLGVGAQLVSLTAQRVSAIRMLTGSLVGVSVLLWLLPANLEHYQGAVNLGGLARGFHAALVLGGPPLLMGSLVLPLLFRLVQASPGAVGRQVGSLLAINTAGGILGSLVASFVLLEIFGLGPSLALLGVGYGSAALLITAGAKGRLLCGATLGASFILIVASPLSPLSQPRVQLVEGEQLVDLREGPYGVVSVIDSQDVRRMKIDNHYTLSGSGPRGPVKERAGHIPLLLHGDPKRVLYVGTATGHTAGAAVMHPVSEIVVVEIVPDVQDLAAAHFAQSNRNVYLDPRTKRVAEDGRNHLRATRETFDVIVADLFAPARPGVGALYAREHFLSVRDRLAPSGLFCQWLPMYQHNEGTFATVASTFLEVFPDAVVFRGDFYRGFPRVALIGYKGEPKPMAEINERVRAMGQRGVTDRWVNNPHAFWMLYVGPLAQLSGSLLRYPSTSDSRPYFEFLAGRARIDERRNFLYATWPRWMQHLAESVPQARYYSDAMPAVKRGADLSRLNHLEQASNRIEHAVEIEALRASLPKNLVSSPDPSALDMPFN